jgi:uncharacterized protein YqgC (DUF456 family)
MSIVWLVAGVALIVVGVVSTPLPAVPGAAIAFLGVVLIGWADDFTRIGPSMLLGLGALALVASLIDNVTGALGARYGGASRWGVIGALVGALAGLPFGLPGVILGPLVGAVVLEFVKNPDVARASRAGAGTLLGFLAGAVLKSALTLLMVGVACLAYFF